MAISVVDGQVTLTGELDTRTEAELPAGYVANVPGVVSVDDSGLGWRHDDLARRGWQTLTRRAR